MGTGAATSAKTAVAQAAVAQGLYAAYQLTNNADYLNGANEAYQFLIDNFYVPELTIFKTEIGNNTAIYTPNNLAILAGGLRDAAIVGNQVDAAAIYVRFFDKIYNPMLLAEAEPSGETGNDSDGDGIPYVAGGTVATVFAAEAEYTISVTSARNDLSASVGLKVYPNPVRGNANIDFNVDGVENIRLSVYDITGREMQVINESGRSLKNNTVKWNTDGLQNGIYFIRIQGDLGLSAVQKVIINK